MEVEICREDGAGNCRQREPVMLTQESVDDIMDTKICRRDELRTSNRDDEVVQDRTFRAEVLNRFEPRFRAGARLH